jgi:hypothetical protein
VQGFKGLRLDGAEGERTDRAEEPGVYKDWDLLGEFWRYQWKNTYKKRWNIYLLFTG